MAASTDTARPAAASARPGPSRGVLAKAILVVPLAAFLGGAAVGGWVAWNMLPALTADEADGHGHDHSTSPFEARRREQLGLFEVTHAARKSLQLKVEPAVVAPMIEQIRMPAVVRELPAVSDLHVSSRLQGMVRRVFVRQGQAIREGDAICELDLTGDALATTQSELLQAVQKLEIVQQEIERLSNFAAGGGVAGMRLIELKYEQRRLEAEREAKRQELVVRGLSSEQVDELIGQKTLIRTTIVRVPRGLLEAAPTEDDPEDSGTAASETDAGDADSPPAVPPAPSPPADPWRYSIEELTVSPGTLVEIGAVVAQLAYHAELLIEGQAFDRDVDLIRSAVRQRRPLSAVLGSDDDPIHLDGLPISYLDNHLDVDTFSYRLYLPLDNQVVQETTEGGRRFRNWKFSPGQRGHVLLPGRQWEGEIPLPIGAVVRDGVDWYVFRLVDSHPREDPPHDDFAPVRVVVLHDEPDRVLVSSDSLEPGTPIAMNQAYRLLLQMKDAQSGGADAHHGHDH